jgi:predicted hydrocarbon binding protein
MEASIKSGYYYANKIARISLLAFEEVMGKNGLNAILNLANLPHLIDNYPPDNLEREFDFNDFSAINQALEQMYGSRGGRNLALRSGRAAFAGALRNFGALAGINDLAYKVLHLQTKLRIGLPAMAHVFTQLSDQHSTVEERDNDFLYTIHRCPVCWGRRDSDKPVCHVATGLLLEGVSWVSSGYEFHIHENHCVAKGDPVCDFIIEKNPIS